jgi:23S rRNA pseudouridine2605 synthase
MNEQMSSTIRLNKFIAERTGISRREADNAIGQGKVILNGQKPPLGAQVGPGDEVTYMGRAVAHQATQTTIMVHKPVGYLSSRRSQGGDPTVYDLLPGKYKNLKTAGRLDKDSSGLMILSSDGDLIQKLTHPRHEKVKIYEIALDRPLEPLHQQMIADFGVDLPDGQSRFTLEEISPAASLPDSIGQSRKEQLDSPIKSANDVRTHWTVTMHEGRNRQIRRTFAALGYTVTKLHRTHLGPYALGDLAPGKWREIS